MTRGKIATEKMGETKVERNLCGLLWSLSGITIALSACAALLYYSPDCRKSNSPIFSQNTTYTTERGEKVKKYFYEGDEKYFAKSNKGWRRLELSEVWSVAKRDRYKIR